MAGSLLDLADSIAAKRVNLGKGASEAAKKFALTTVAELAYKTPVDTSQALSNWTVTIESPATGKHGPHFGGIGGSSYRASAAETVALAKKALEAKKPGQAIWITNNQPYINRLNDGYSAQAPAGFIEAAILVGRRTLKTFKYKG